MDRMDDFPPAAWLYVLCRNPARTRRKLQSRILADDMGYQSG